MFMRYDNKNHLRNDGFDKKPSGKMPKPDNTKHYIKNKINLNNEKIDFFIF